MNVVELAIVLHEEEGHRTEQSELVALPFIPRVGEMILWNYASYTVTNVLYSFETNPADYNFDAHPNKQSTVAHDICYKVFLKAVR